MPRYYSLLIMLALVSGCYESTDVTVAEPGVYKGKIDRHALDPAVRNKLLQKRFDQVQTDR